MQIVKQVHRVYYIEHNKSAGRTHIINIERCDVLLELHTEECSAMGNTQNKLSTTFLMCILHVQNINI